MLAATGNCVAVGVPVLVTKFCGGTSTIGIVWWLPFLKSADGRGGDGFVKWLFFFSVAGKKH